MTNSPSVQAASAVELGAAHFPLTIPRFAGQQRPKNAMENVMTTNHPDEIQTGPAGVLPNGLKISSDMSTVSRQLYISNKDGSRIVDLDDKDQKGHTPMPYNWRDIHPLSADEGEKVRELAFAAANQVQKDHDSGPFSWQAKVGQHTNEAIEKYGREAFDRAYIDQSLAAYLDAIRRGKEPPEFLKIRAGMLREMGVPLTKPQFDGDD